ncbi:MAG: AsmA family protein [Magnetococcales bacterium]|nr:AsmA family protein [Magnetococcales bacterium]
MKKLIFILIIPIIIVIGAIVALPMLVDPNQFKQEITNQIKERTGRDVTVNGPITLSVFPWAGVTLADVTVGDAPGFGTDPFAQVARLEVRAKLMPLLSKRLEADKIAVQGLMLKLVRDAKGRGNWEELSGSKPALRDEAKVAAKGNTPAATPGKPALPQTAPGTGATTGLEAITLGGVELRDSRITWNNGVSGAKYSFHSLQLTTGAVTPGQPVTVELSTDVERVNPATKAHLTFGATVIVGLQNKELTLQKTKLGLSMQAGEGAPVTQAELQLTAELHAALDGSRIKASGLELTLKTEGGSFPLAKSEHKLQGNVELSPTRITFSGLNGTLKGVGKTGAPFNQLEARYKGEIDGQRSHLFFNLSGLELTVKAEGGTLPAGGADLRLTGNAEADLIKQTARLTGIKVEGLGQLKAEGTLNLVKQGEHTKASGEWNVHPFNLRTLLTQLGQKLPDTADEKSLTALQLKGTLGADSQRLDVSRMEAKLDDITLRGGFSWPYDGVSALRLDLEADSVDLDRYLPARENPAGNPVEAKSGTKPGTAPASDKKDTAPSATAASGAGSDELPVARLKRLEVDGRLKAGRLKVRGMTLQEFQAVLKGKDGLMRLEPASCKLHGGSTRIDATLDLRGETPKLTWKQNLQGVQIASLLQELQQEESLTGTANLTLNLTSSGKNGAALKQGLNGQLSFAIQEGAYLKTDLAHTIRQAYGAYAAAKGRPMTPSRDTGRTPFQSLNGTGEIRNGILDTQNLQATSPAFKMTGAGKVDLPQDRLDLTTRVSPLTSLEDVNTQSLNDLKGMTIPVRIHGDLFKPQTSVDLAGLLEQAVKTKAMEKVQEKLQEKLGGKLQEKLGGGDLQKLLPFGR